MEERKERKEGRGEGSKEGNLGQKASSELLLAPSFSLKILHKSCGKGEHLKSLHWVREGEKDAGPFSYKTGHL